MTEADTITSILNMMANIERSLRNLSLLTNALEVRVQALEDISHDKLLRLIEKSPPNC